MPFWVCALASFLKRDTSLGDLWRGTFFGKVPPSDLPVGKSAGAFPWLSIDVEESPAHCEWGHPWAGGPGLCKKASWAYFREQASKQPSVSYRILLISAFFKHAFDKFYQLKQVYAQNAGTVIWKDFLRSMGKANDSCNNPSKYLCKCWGSAWSNRGYKYDWHFLIA